MMKARRIWSIILVVCLLSGCVAACGTKENSGVAGTETENLQTTETQSTDSTETETERVTENSENDTEVAVETETPETTVSESEETNTITSEKEETEKTEQEENKKPVKDSETTKKPEKDKPSKPEKEYKPSKLEKNIFFDSLVYTGYNIEKHRADGMMWKYLLASKKRAKGWLSNIGYAGGSSGYETTKDGKPDIRFFEKNGLVCASYATYVYYNYLPNVAGIDVSKLAKPKKSYNADDWYKAAQKWIKDGYSKEVGFKASLTSSGFIKFSLDEEIPIGSIIAFCDAKNKSDVCSHIVIYAGYKNNYHWVYHVGNDNGPEFCAVERMHFGPDPQWPIAVITTPDFIVEQMNE